MGSVGRRGPLLAVERHPRHFAASRHRCRKGGQHCGGERQGTSAGHFSNLSGLDGYRRREPGMPVSK